MRSSKKLPLRWQLPIAACTVIGFAIGRHFAAYDDRSPAPMVGMILCAFAGFVILQICERLR